MPLRQDCDQVVAHTLSAVQPGPAVARALTGRSFSCGRLYLVAVGKAAWPMADAALKALSRPVNAGIVITKYGHSQGPLPGVKIYEAGHPVPDAAGLAATRQALALTEDLKPEDTVLLLLSGGGSALLEQPLLPLEQLQELTEQLLRSGAEIGEINQIRKRLSAVKGGRFAQHCAPAKVLTLALSDVLGDRPEMIASGPSWPDPAPPSAALSLAEKYHLRCSPQCLQLLGLPAVSQLSNTEYHIIGSVKQLCATASEKLQSLGYRCIFLTDCLSCQARDAGAYLAAIARSQQDLTRSTAYIAGGETVVRVTGHGKGGRNQELALSAALGIRGLRDTAVFSLGSDGTDGPTDAAGGFVTGESADTLYRLGTDPVAALAENNAYHALSRCGGLLFTGPTGTNVNDLSVLLIHR